MGLVTENCSSEKKKKICTVWKDVNKTKRSDILHFHVPLLKNGKVKDYDRKKIYSLQRKGDNKTLSVGCGFYPN